MGAGLWCKSCRGGSITALRKRTSSWATTEYCDPLTVADYASRYLLFCEVMESNQEYFAFTVFERLFKGTWFPASDPLG